MDNMTEKDMLLTALCAEPGDDNNDIFEDLKSLYLYIADSVLFPVDAIRPLSESERRGLSLLRHIIAILKD